MLSTIQLKNFRCFKSTGKVKLSKINIFIGANNAGKSSVLSVIELLLRSGHMPFGNPSPLRFVEQPEFAAYSSLLRKAWSKNEPRATFIEFDAEWSLPNKKPESVWSNFRIKGDEKDDLCYVDTATYGTVTRKSRSETIVELQARQKTNRKEKSEFKLVKPRSSATVWFIGPFPMLAASRNQDEAARKTVGPITSFAFEATRENSALSVLTPHRPVPKRLYVLDDPSMTKSDRELMSYLGTLWQSDEAQAESVKSRIEDGLKKLRLANHIDVTRPVRGSTAAFQVRVSTGSKRDLVTIADVGFGLSQALPLLTKDAALSNGVLVAYQPEVHLHPFAQSRLADIFVASASRGNSLYIETHSAEMILRLQYLIASGAVANDDVSVFCIEKDKKQSRIRPMAFDESGRPGTRWPNGFLDTSLILAQDLTKARNA